MMKKLITLLLLTGLGCGFIKAQTNESIVLIPNNTGSEATANTSGQNGIHVMLVVHYQ